MKTFLALHLLMHEFALDFIDFFAFLLISIVLLLNLYKVFIILMFIFYLLFFLLLFIFFIADNYFFF